MLIKILKHFYSSYIINLEIQHITTTWCDLLWGNNMGGWCMRFASGGWLFMTWRGHKWGIIRRKKGRKKKKNIVIVLVATFFQKQIRCIERVVWCCGGERWGAFTFFWLDGQGENKTCLHFNHSRRRMCWWWWRFNDDVLTFANASS